MTWLFGGLQTWVGGLTGHIRLATFPCMCLGGRGTHALEDIKIGLDFDVQLRSDRGTRLPSGQYGASHRSLTLYNPWKRIISVLMYVSESWLPCCPEPALLQAMPQLVVCVELLFVNQYPFLKCSLLQVSRFRSVLTDLNIQDLKESNLATVRCDSSACTNQSLSVVSWKSGVLL